MQIVGVYSTHNVKTTIVKYLKNGYIYWSQNASQALDLCFVLAQFVMRKNIQLLSSGNPLRILWCSTKIVITVVMSMVLSWCVVHMLVSGQQDGCRLGSDGWILCTCWNTVSFIDTLLTLHGGNLAKWSKPWQSYADIKKDTMKIFDHLLHCLLF